jgi:predicted phage-related endonuclease
MLDLLTLGLTPEQHAQRSRWVGGSDALAIVSGGDAWLQLWLQKTGRAAPADLSDVLAVVMGQYTEPLNIAWFQRQTGRQVSGCREQRVHSRLPFIGVTLDGLTTTEDGFDATLQAKHVSQSNEAMELRYTAQCTHEALVLGYDHYVMSVFVGSSKWELYEREVDPFFAAEYLALCEEFWDYVVTDREPPAPPPLPVPPPRRLRTVDMTASNIWAEYAGVWRSLKPSHQRFEAAAKELKRLIEPDVGLATGHGVQVKRGRNDALYISECK